MYDVAEEDLFARRCSTAVEGGGLFGSRDGMMHRGRICVVVDLGARMLLHIGFFFSFPARQRPSMPTICEDYRVRRK